jgi:hypothetical protein
MNVVASAGNRSGWQVAENGVPLALAVVLHKASYVLPWSQFLYAEGGDDQVRLVFATHDVLVKGCGLNALLADVASHRVAALVEPPNTDRFLTRAGRCVSEVAVRKASREAE